MADASQLLGRTLLLVAHPDDETVGCGTLLQRMAAPIVIFATDGAPRDQYFWGKYGARLRYQRIREDEARKALALIGVSEVKFFGSEPVANGEVIVDQELYLQLPDAFERLTRLVELNRPEAILTLAYEGGHPDHDCCSFLAASLVTRFKLPAWEFPLYFRSSSGEPIRQQFVSPDPGGEEAFIAPTPEEFVKKKAMLQAYSSQHPFLLDFNPTVELFRPQRKYDYSRPPHSGALNYEAWGWPITSADLCIAFRDFAAHYSAVSQ